MGRLKIASMSSVCCSLVLLSAQRFVVHVGHAHALVHVRIRVSHTCSYSVGAFAPRSPHIACGRVYLRRRLAPRTATHAHMHAQTYPPSIHARVCTTYALHAAHACAFVPVYSR